MKKALSIILAAACMMNFTACGDDDNGGGSKSSKASKEQSIEDCIVRIKDYKIKYIEDDQKEYLIIYYEFYNDQKEEKSFNSLFSSKIFQNGVECNAVRLYFWNEDPDYDQECNDKEVLPGYTYTANVAYEIADHSDVTVKVTEFSYTNKKKTYIDETISLENAKYSSDATESTEETSE